MSLAGRNALVTGSTGIALQILHRLAKRGCNILFNGYGEGLELDKIKHNLIKEYGINAEYLKVDLSKRHEVEHMCSVIASKYPNGLDILVNNAAHLYTGQIEDTPLKEFDKIIAIGLSAPYCLIRQSVAKMKDKGWGRIVNIASVHGLCAAPGKSAYSAAKHGLVGITKVVALETAEFGVTCNAICPGFVVTPMTQKRIDDKVATGMTHEEAANDIARALMPTGRAIQAEEIADMVDYLCSESARSVTGSAIVVDGGWTAR